MTIYDAGPLAAGPLCGLLKKGHYERGLFSGGISRISKISKFSRISRKWPASPLFSRAWGFSKISRISKFSRISRNGLFWKDPFSKRPLFPNPNLGPAPLHRCVGDFCCINIGGFCRGFSWRIFLGTFSNKNEEKKSGDEIRVKIRRPNNKNLRKSPFCQNPTLINHHRDGNSLRRRGRSMLLSWERVTANSYG